MECEVKLGTRINGKTGKQAGAESSVVVLKQPNRRRGGAAFEETPADLAVEMISLPLKTSKSKTMSKM